MALASTSVLLVEGVPQNGFCQHLCPQSISPLFSASLGSTVRSTSVSDPGPFQWIASVLGLGACEILHETFKSGISVSLSPKHKFCWSSKPDILRIHLPSARPLGWGTQCRAQTPCSLGRILNIAFILLFVGCLSKGVNLKYAASLPLLPMSFWFLLYIFNYRKSFLLVFKLF